MYVRTPLMQADQELAADHARQAAIDAGDDRRRSRRARSPGTAPRKNACTFSRSIRMNAPIISVKKNTKMPLMNPATSVCAERARRR